MNRDMAKGIVVGALSALAIIIGPIFIAKILPRTDGCELYDDVKRAVKVASQLEARAVSASKAVANASGSAKRGPGRGIIPQKRLQGVSGGFSQKMVVTAYCPCPVCCGRWADGFTASGHKILPGDRFAASPPAIPFGTLLGVMGYNNGQPVPVLDRGGSIQRNRLDIFFDNHTDALNWGVRIIDVIIYSKGDTNDF